MPKRTATVHQSGITVNHKTLWHSSLAPLVGEKVTVIVNESYPDEAMVVRQNQFLCYARTEALMSARATEEEFHHLYATKKSWRESVKGQINYNQIQPWQPAQPTPPETIDIQQFAARANPMITGLEGNADAASKMLSASANDRISAEERRKLAEQAKNG